MSRWWKTYCHPISTKRVLACFAHGSPLSRRTVRRRLGYPAQSVVSKVLFTAVEQGHLRRVQPVEVGSAKHFLHVYAPVV